MNKIGLFWFWSLTFLLLSCNHSEKQTLPKDKNYSYGKVVKIFDGDTYELLTTDYQQIKIRMEGIDAPERDMAFHSVSRRYLSDLIFKKEIKFRKTGEDIHGRSLGFTYLEDGTDINLKMIEAGMAWHFKRYNHDKIYENAENKARVLKLGLWQDEQPTPPWEFRKYKGKQVQEVNF